MLRTGKFKQRFETSFHQQKVRVESKDKKPIFAPDSFVLQIRREKSYYLLQHKKIKS